MEDQAEIERLTDLLNLSEFKSELLGAAFETLLEVVFKRSGMLQNKSDYGIHTPDHNAKPDYYAFVPFKRDRYTEAALLISIVSRLFQHESYTPSFLDVGCGLGNIMLLASCTFESYGIEFSEQYVKAARKVLGQTISPRPGCSKKQYLEEHIIHADALEYNGYDKYDVIYYYCPIRNNNKMNILAGRILSQMRVGSVLISLGHSSFTHNKHTYKFYGKGDTYHHHPNIEIINSGSIVRKKGKL